MKKVFFGQVGQLKEEKIEEYKKLHKNAWPGVLETITKCNIINYSIFLHGNIAFSYYKYIGDDYEADLEKMAQDPVTQEWWTHTKPCFVKYSMSDQAEFFCDMEQVFYHE